MQELIDKLKAEAGLTDEQAKKAIAAIKNYVVESSDAGRRRWKSFWKRIDLT
jgi:hypothetical protein